MTMTLKRSPHLGVGTYEASGTARMQEQWKAALRVHGVHFPGDEQPA